MTDSLRRTRIKESVRLEYLPGIWYRDASGVLHDVDDDSVDMATACDAPTPDFIGYVRLTKVVGEPEPPRNWCPTCKGIREDREKQS